MFEDTDSKIDVVFNFEYVDTFFIQRLSPGWEVYLHDADCITVRNREGVASALNNDDGGDQAGVDIVLAAAAHDRLRHAVALRLVDVKFFQKRIDSVYCGVRTRDLQRCVRLAQRLVRSFAGKTSRVRIQKLCL